MLASPTATCDERDDRGGDGDSSTLRGYRKRWTKRSSMSPSEAENDDASGISSEFVGEDQQTFLKKAKSADSSCMAEWH